MTAEAKIRTTFALVLTVLLLILGLWYSDAVVFARSNAEVEHTLQVQRELARIEAELFDLESSNRGYVLTGKTSFTDRSQKARALALESYDRIAKLTADNPSEQERLPRLREALAEKLEFNRQLVSRFDEEGPDAARTLFATGRGRPPMEAVLKVVEEMKTEESRLLLTRAAEARRSGNRAILLGASIALGLVLIIATLYRLIGQEMASRASSAQELDRANRFLDALIENIPDMIFVKDAERLAFTRMNRAGEAFLSVDRKELLGKNDFDFFPKAEAEFFQEKDRKTLLEKTLVDIPEEHIQTKNGARWLHTKKVPILSEDGTPLFLLGISEDITGRKETQDAMRRAKEQAEATGRELEAFSYSVSHDLRAPLRSIDGFCQAILEESGESLQPASQGYFQRVRKAAQRMGELIDDLLKLSRVSRSELKLEPVDLTRLAREVAAGLARDLPARAVRFTAQEGLVAHGDARLLRVAFENLLGNAWKFTSKRSDPAIEFGCLAAAGPRSFYVRDNGAGFDLAYASQLFGAFQRLHAASEFEGTGIGLATVQRIIHRHGGRIWAEARPGEGATFHFTLPGEA